MSRGGKREGAGRKPGGGPVAMSFTVRLYPDEFDQLCAFAARLGMPRAAVVRQLLMREASNRDYRDVVFGERTAAEVVDEFALHRASRDDIEAWLVSMERAPDEAPPYWLRWREACVDEIQAAIWEREAD